MRMPNYKSARRSMRHRLGGYMAALAALLIAAVCIGLFSFGRLSSPKAEITHELQTQIVLFQDDMHSLWQNVSTSAVHLSEDMTEILEDCLSESGVDFGDLTGDLDTLTAIEDAMLDPLCQYIRQTRCSGAFVVLDAAMRTDSEPDVRSGLCVQKNNAERTSNELLLFRGMPGVSKAHGVMPHRKWQQEFRTTQFPNYDACTGATADSLWDARRITDLITLPGTSEEAIMLTVPMIAEDGTVYGICGFSVNQTYFGAHFEHPSDLSRLACILTANTGDTLDVDAGLTSFIKDGSCTLPSGALSTRTLSGDLILFSGSGYDFVGMMQQVSFAKGDSNGHTLAVLTPKEDYDRAVFGGIVQAVLFAFLMVFVAVACCAIFVRRFLKPVYEDMRHLQSEKPDRAQMTFDDFAPLTKTIAAREESHKALITALENEKESFRNQYKETQSQLETVQTNATELAKKRKDEIDPDSFALFVKGYQNLTDSEKEVLESMLEGVSPREFAQQTGRELSTVYTHRKNIYSRLSISGTNRIQQLRTCMALMRQEWQST